MEHDAASCRWATLVLFLDAPWWYDADDCRWACARGTAPRILEARAVCAGCAHWTPRRREEADSDNM